MGWRNLREELAEEFGGCVEDHHDLVAGMLAQSHANKAARERARYLAIKADPVKYAALLAWFREYNRRRYQSRPDVRAKATAYSKAKWARTKADPDKLATHRAERAAWARKKRAAQKAKP